MLCAFNQFDCPGLFGYIVSLFKSSTIACATFKEAQECERPYSLKQECPTRWNTGYYMLDQNSDHKDCHRKCATKHAQRANAANI